MTELRLIKGDLDPKTTTSGSDADLDLVITDLGRECQAEAVSRHPASNIGAAVMEKANDMPHVHSANAIRPPEGESSFTIAPPSRMNHPGQTIQQPTVVHLPTSRS